MGVRSVSIGSVAAFIFASAILMGADAGTEFELRLNRAISRLNHEAKADADGPALLAQLIQREYGTDAGEVKWAADHAVSWGDIAAFAYIRATTGRSFERLAKEDAGRDFRSYVEKAEMSPDKMALSLESFVKEAETERNTRIFERLRASRRVEPMPDLGSGFGLFQESLDFRRIDASRLAKVHTVVVLGKN